MKSCLPGLFLLLSSSTVSGLGSVLARTVVHIQNYYTWQNAQTFCRSVYSDLAVLLTQSDVDSMYLDQYVAWVRSHGDDDILDLTLNFSLWENWYQPSQGCAYVNYNEKRLHGADCGEYYFFICSSKSPERYVFVSESLTWLEAEQRCQTSYDGLAVLRDPGHLDSAAKRRDFPVWTGLHRDGESWRWSAGVSDYRNWAPNEPSSDGDCVAVSSVSKTMSTHSCSDRFPFVCFKDNLLLVKENRTWEEALDHCKALRSPSGAPYQLVSVQPDDYTHMMHRAMEADGDEVWTGLRYLAGGWFWVNGADVALSDLPRCPVAGQHCGAFSRNDPGGLEARDCLEERNFLCYSQW